MGETETMAGFRVGDRIVYRYLGTHGRVVGLDLRTGKVVVELESEATGGILRAAMNPGQIERWADAAAA